MYQQRLAMLHASLVAAQAGTHQQRDPRGSSAAACHVGAVVPAHTQHARPCRWSSARPHSAAAKVGHQKVGLTRFATSPPGAPSGHRGEAGPGQLHSASQVEQEEVDAAWRWQPVPPRLHSGGQGRPQWTPMQRQSFQRRFQVHYGRRGLMPHSNERDALRFKAGQGNNSRAPAGEGEDVGSAIHRHRRATRDATGPPAAPSLRPRATRAGADVAEEEWTSMWKAASADAVSAGPDRGQLTAASCAGDAGDAGGHTGPMTQQRAASGEACVRGFSGKRGDWRPGLAQATGITLSTRASIKRPPRRAAVDCTASRRVQVQLPKSPCSSAGVDRHTDGQEELQHAAQHNGRRRSQESLHENPGASASTLPGGAMGSSSADRSATRTHEAAALAIEPWDTHDHLHHDATKLFDTQG